MRSEAMGTAPENPLFELQQTIYASGNYTRRRLHQTRLKWVRDAIAAQAPVARAIEYGPGSGVYLPSLAERSAQVTAADVESAYLSGIDPLARTLKNVQLCVDDIQRSRFDDDSFDLVLCSEVLEHVPDPERSLRTLFRILRPGGVAILSTPQRFSLLELCCKLAFLPGVLQLVRLVYREPVLPTGHISLRTAGAFRSAIEGCGFEVVRCAKFGLYLPLLAEFGGAAGGRAIERLEHALADTVFDHAFWTQAYVARKPG